MATRTVTQSNFAATVQQGIVQAMRPAQLDRIVDEVRQLDMDEIRRKIDAHERATAHEGGA